MHFIIIYAVLVEKSFNLSLFLQGNVGPAGNVGVAGEPGLRVSVLLGTVLMHWPEGFRDSTFSIHKVSKNA